MWCCVKGCKYFGISKRKITPDVRLHKFPDKYKRPHDFLKWRQILQINFPAEREAYVCSTHFHETDYHKRLLPSVCKLLSYKPKMCLRLDAVPHLNLKPQEQDVEQLLPTVIQSVEVKQESEQDPYFPQETVYLPPSSAELYEENSEGEQSDASSEDQSLFDEEIEEAPFQKAASLSQVVQCELGSEKFRDFSDDRDLVDAARSSTGNTDDAASEGLDGIAIISNEQKIQCELGKETNRWEMFVESNRRKKRINVKRYVCVTGSDCPCGLPKSNNQPDFDSTVFVKSNHEEDHHEDDIDECSGFKNSEGTTVGDANYNECSVFENSEGKTIGDANYNECSVCENKANKTVDGRRAFRRKEETTPYSRPMEIPHFDGNYRYTLERNLRQRELVQLRQTMSSIIHKRSTPNILRKRH